MPKKIAAVEKKTSQHALQDIRHAIEDFDHAMQDLRHLREDLSKFVAQAQELGVDVSMADACAYVAAQVTDR